MVGGYPLVQGFQTRAADTVLLVSTAGALFMNVCLDDRADRTADKLAARFQRNGWNIRLIDTPRIPARNAVVLGGKVNALRAPKLIV